MPFCVQCGNSVNPHDVFCPKCGARQPVSAAPSYDYMGGISPRTASLLCYIPGLGWIAAIIVLAAARFRDNWRVRFNAFQGLYLFVAWLIVDWVLSPLLRLPFDGFHPFSRLISTLPKAAIFGAWIFMIIKASQDEVFKLPILGELAERSMTEQR